MAQQAGHDVVNKAEEMTGLVQKKKDELLQQVNQEAQEKSQHEQAQSHQSDQNSSSDVVGQATQFIQQTGEQVKNMAQGAAEAVKNTLGMTADNNTPNHGGSNPSNISKPSSM